MKVSASTRLFAILGDPVAHSLSPRMQNAAFQAAGVDAVYVALRPTLDLLPHVVNTLIANGGGGNFTIPFKIAGAALPGDRTDRVATLGSANVFAGAGGALHLANTDVDGVVATVRSMDAASGAWLVLGTGGSARAVAGAALECGVRIAVRSREASRATEFADWCTSIGVAAANADECNLIVNATPLGLRSDDAVPLSVASIAPGTAILDLTYRRDGATRWVSECRALGHVAQDGKEVLVAQGAAAWAHWFGNVAPPVDVMRAAVHGSLD